jgi:hypothetical protein
MKHLIVSFSLALLCIPIHSLDIADLMDTHKEHVGPFGNDSDPQAVAVLLGRKRMRMEKLVNDFSNMKKNRDELSLHVEQRKSDLMVKTGEILSKIWFNKKKEKVVLDINRQLFIKESKDSGLRYIFDPDPLECHQSVSFNASEDALLICTDKRILLHDIKVDKNQTIIKRDHSEIYVSAKFNRTEDSILICTNKRVLLFDINKKAYKVLFDGSLSKQKRIAESCWHANFSQSESSVLIHTNKRIIHHDLATVVNKAIFRAGSNESCRSFSLSSAENSMVIQTENRVVFLDASGRKDYDIVTGNKNIKSAIFGKDGKEIIICADNAVIVYDIQNRDLRYVFKADIYEKCKFGIFNRSKDAYCLLTNKRIVLFNTVTGLFQEIYKKDNIQSVTFNDQENELLVSTEQELIAVPFI